MIDQALDGKYRIDKKLGQSGDKYSRLTGLYWTLTAIATEGDKQ